MHVVQEVQVYMQCMHMHRFIYIYTLSYFIYLLQITLDIFGKKHLKFHSQDYALLAKYSENAETVLEKADDSMAPLTGKKRKATAGDD